MKKVLFFLFLGGAVLLHQVKAQSPADTAVSADKPDSVNTEEVRPGTIIYRYDRTLNVVQNSGKTFTSGEINRMPVSNVNQVAETVAGVQRMGNGAAPNIRGAGSAGTAYFVDGVRVYGALPPVMNP